MQHLKTDSKSRDDWKEFHKRLQRDPQSVWQYIIGNAHFQQVVDFGRGEQVDALFAGVRCCQDPE